MYFYLLTMFIMWSINIIGYWSYSDEYSSYKICGFPIPYTVDVHHSKIFSFIDYQIANVVLLTLTIRLLLEKILKRIKKISKFPLDNIKSAQQVDAPGTGSNE